MESVAERAMDRMYDLAVAIDDLMNARLSRHSLTPARAEVLWVLHRRGPSTQRELSEILHCTPRNVTGLIDVLADSGFVHRVPHPADRRAVQVSLSKKGRLVLAEWEAERATGAARALGGIPDAELHTFTQTLDRILANLRRSHHG